MFVRISPTVNFSAYNNLNAFKLFLPFSLPGLIPIPTAPARALPGRVRKLSFFFGHVQQAAGRSAVMDQQIPRAKYQDEQ